MMGSIDDKGISYIKERKAALADWARSFVGQELIRITINTYSVEFEFTDDFIDVGSLFTFSNASDAETVFEPGKQQGDVQKLWPLIGKVVTDVDWNNSFELLFDGAAVKIAPGPWGCRGTLRGKRSEPGTLMIEDF